MKVPMRELNRSVRGLSVSMADAIIIEAACVNLRTRKWGNLERLVPQLTESRVSRVMREFEASPTAVIEFFRWIEEREERIRRSVETCSTFANIMIRCRRFEECMRVMQNLMRSYGVSAAAIMEGLLRCGETDRAAFDALVRACTRCDKTDDAYRTIKTLESRGSPVTINAWSHFLSHLLKKNELRRFWNAYREMISFGHVENVFVFNTVVFALCKELRFAEAMSVFYGMLKRGITPSVVSLNMIINGSGREGDCLLPMKVFREIDREENWNWIRPNLMTYNSLINGFCKAGRMPEAEEIHREMIVSGIEPDARTSATLIDGYCKSGNVDSALKLCVSISDRGQLPNTVVYNTIIHCLFEEGDVESASVLLSEMIEESIIPDQFTFSILTKALCRCGLLRFAKNLMNESFSCNIAMKCLFVNRNLPVAKQLLGHMILAGVSPDLITYGTWIDGCCKQQKMSEALDMFGKMRQGGGDARPNTVIFNSIVNGFCKELYLDRARFLLSKLRIHGDADAVTYNTLVHGCCIAGKADDALALLAEMEKSGISMNAVTYNTVMNFFCLRGQSGEAMAALKIMITNRVRPDSFTYRTMIRGSSRSAGAEDLIALHDHLILEGAVPDEHSYRIFISPLLEAQRPPNPIG